MKKSKLMTLVVALSLLASSCAQKEESSSSETAAVPVPSPLVPNLPGSTPTTPVDTAGTVPFVPVSKTMMEAYVASHSLNNPTNYRISIKLKNAGDFRYAGEVKIMYEDTGSTYTGVFTAPEGVNQPSSINPAMRDTGAYKAQYNYWYNVDGKTVFSGFFQDPYGGIIIVIDNAINLGDAQGGGTVSGSIWFKNFAYSMEPHQMELRNCWFIYSGPYVCGSSSIINKTSLEPTDGYRKLGTFSGLVKSSILQ